MTPQISSSYLETPSRPDTQARIRILRIWLTVSQARDTSVKEHLGTNRQTRHLQQVPQFLFPNGRKIPRNGADAPEFPSLLKAELSNSLLIQRFPSDTRESPLRLRSYPAKPKHSRFDTSALGSRNYPTDPSICNWISRFISTAYSIGSSLTSGSMKPLTIIALASSSGRPRLIR